MIWHPLLLSVLTMDIFGAGFISAAVLSSLRIAGAWSPESPGEAQLALERKAETASFQARTGCVLLLISTVVLVAGLTGVLPDLVPGAMCGTGVLQATRGTGARALALRGIALGLLGVWHLLDRLNRTRPESPLATVAARALLLASPAVFLAVYDTFRAILRLDTHRPVDCCSIVYDQVRTVSRAGGESTFPEAWSVWVLALGGAAILLLGMRLHRSVQTPGTPLTGVVACSTVLWVPMAVSALVNTLAAYHYGVLQHRCPWCLFLPEHGLVGYPLFVALILVIIESGAALICSIVGRRFPALASETHRRSRRAGLRITLSTGLFLALSGLPPVLWRLRFGVWMG
jgi:hypothetical protein